MAGGPGPANAQMSDLEPNKKWGYKYSKAGIIGNKTKEFEKDRQYFANLLHLNRSRDVPGPGEYDNEVEPCSPKKTRDDGISPRRKRLLR